MQEEALHTISVTKLYILGRLLRAVCEQPVVVALWAENRILQKGSPRTFYQNLSTVDTKAWFRRISHAVFYNLCQRWMGEMSSRAAICLSGPPNPANDQDRYIKGLGDLMRIGPNLIITYLQVLHLSRRQHGLRRKLLCSENVSQACLRRVSRMRELPEL
jgi:hypothetical protein